MHVLVLFLHMYLLIVHYTVEVKHIPRQQMHKYILLSSALQCTVFTMCNAVAISLYTEPTNITVSAGSRRRCIPVPCSSHILPL